MNLAQMVKSSTLSHLWKFMLAKFFLIFQNFCSPTLFFLNGLA